MLSAKTRRLSSILFQTRIGARLTPSQLWMTTKPLRFKSLEIVKKEGEHACLMIGRFSTGSRPSNSAITLRFLHFQKQNPGFFQQIEQYTGDDAHEVFFIPVPYSSTGNIDDTRDSTTLCRQFACIKFSIESDIYKGSHELIDDNKYREIEAKDSSIAYDVVKKHATIAATNEAVGADVTSALLGGDKEAEHFYQFSAEVFSVIIWRYIIYPNYPPPQVLGALETVSATEATILHEERAWMAGDPRCALKQRVGFMYGAWNPCIGDGVVKIGATMRASPLPRLKELSRSLPTDFQLVSMVPSTDPFGLESRAHAHFAAKRVMRSSTGRTTEFFTVSREEVDEYFAGVMGGGKD